MRSMTGYGHFFHRDDKYDIEIEIKSVNSRYFDLNIYTDRIISHLDSFIREKIVSSIKRGRITVNINVTNKQEENLELNTNYLQKLYELHQQANDLLKADNSIAVQDLMRYDNVLVRRENKINDEQFLEAMSYAIDSCLSLYDEMTRQEGLKMSQWIVLSVNRIKEAVAVIEEELPLYRNELKNKLTKSLEEFLKQPFGEDTEKRLMTEVTLYMDKADVTEEIVRLEAHINKTELLFADKTTETGRKLNFIFQEMHRETQTIGSKFNSVKVFPSILLIKEEIEKCRELIQNVE